MTSPQPVIERVTDFINTGVWRLKIKQLSWPHKILIRLARTFILAVRDFQADNCALRASSLTFFSLLSLVPVAAMTLGVAKGFGFREILEKQLHKSFSGQEEIVTRVVEFAQSFLDSVRGGLVAGIGVAVLFWTVVRVLGNIEDSFNTIWKTKTKRSLGRKFADYLSIVLIGTVFFIVSTSVMVFITIQVTLIAQKLVLWGPLAKMLFGFLKLLPYGLIWILFSFIYIIMPNTQVKLVPGVVAGIIGGTLFLIVQWGYINFQVGAAKYNAIYGSFAALPLFLVWLQISWLIVLFGAEISHAYQCADLLEYAPDCRGLSLRYRNLVALNVSCHLVHRFINGKEPSTAEAIAEHMELPLCLVNQGVDDLVECDILTHIPSVDSKPDQYQPARDINQLTIAFVLDALRRRGTDTFPIDLPDNGKTILQALETFDNEMQNHPLNRRLAEI